MPSIFTKIIQGDIPCYKVAEDANNIAFLDINPVAKGHLLCVPKIEVDNLFDLPTSDYQSLMLFTQSVARGLAQAVPCMRVGLCVIGTEVPHAHIHLIPFETEKQMNIVTSKKQSFTPEEMNQIASTIASHII